MARLSNKVCHHLVHKKTCFNGKTRWSISVMVSGHRHSEGFKRSKNVSLKHLVATSFKM